ncbi:MAG: hypothetical protein HC811_01635 [Flammeovirgaceae bacterium]|nr:hypothetical protein [Flammeovirgaceae bacterium]
MIDIKDATVKVTEYLQLFYPNATKIQVEEMELSEDKKFWNITLSFEPDEPQSGSFLITSKNKKFKTFVVDYKKWRGAVNED